MFSVISYLKLQLDLIRFLVVGCLNTIVGYLIFVVFSIFGFKAFTALACAYFFGVLFNYYSLKNLVFMGQGGVCVFVKFVSTYVFIYFVNLHFLTELVAYGVPQVWSQAILIPFVSGSTFFLMRVLVFPSK